MKKISLKDIIAFAKNYGFIFPSSDIYEGLSAVYDYGQMGVLLKNNIKEYWWKSMVQLNEDIVGIDAAILMHPTTWKASGHVDGFNDPMVDNKDSKKRYRADNLIENKIEELEKLGQKTAADILQKAFDDAISKNDLNKLKDLIIENNIVCPESKTSNWTDVRQFNLMFSTSLGAMEESANTIYLRPETAQGIFVNFLNVQKSGRMRIPFGIAQIGKAFRNEVVARQFIIRMREFEQMEMQYFVRPNEDLKWFEHWKEKRMAWHLNLGFSKDKFRFLEHKHLAHYANAAFDIEYNFPMGFKELEGIHSRTDFDLSQHQKFSGKKMQYFDNEINTSYVPHVIETSIGLDRMFLCVLSECYNVEEVDNNGKIEERQLLKLPPVLAPIKLAVLPLTKKDGLPDVGRKIVSGLTLDYHVTYDEKDSIGKRYRRNDAIGTPYCVTVDHDTLSDSTVTVRKRDDMSQERIPIDKLKSYVSDKLQFSSVLKNL